MIASVDVCPTLRAGGNRTGGDRPPGTDVDTADSLIAAVADPLCANEQHTWTHEGRNNFRTRNVITQPVANALTHRMHKGVNTTMDEGQTMVAHALRADGFDASEDGTGRGTPMVAWSIMPQNSGKDFKAREVEVAQPLMGNGPVSGNQGGDYIQTPVAFAENSRAELRLCGGDGNVSSQLTAGGGKPGQGHAAVSQGYAVRRLTPTECERLQGFPDGYTAVRYRGRAAADGPRYKALGNSMAVNVMRWLGRRIELVEGL